MAEQIKVKLDMKLKRAILYAGASILLVGLVIGFIWGRVNAPVEIVEVPEMHVEICKEAIRQAKLNQKDIYLMLEKL